MQGFRELGCAWLDSFCGVVSLRVQPSWLTTTGLVGIKTNMASAMLSAAGNGMRAIREVA
ncbi:hypothetical protein KCP70_04540 [Salmonella enterica subsp. enterica]|nr:hypothetical protein KCP70_04540 [Salmonella enterica subsp. enterica]